MQIITHKRHTPNISQTERIISVIGGGILATTGLTKRSASGLALALIGGDLLRRGLTGHSFVYEALGVRTAPVGQGNASLPYELGVRVDRAVTINRPRAEVFRFWRSLSNLPRFMRHIESVQEIDSNRSHWVVKAPAGRKVEWDAVIHNEVEHELIGWRSLPGADVDNAGSVAFRDAPGGRGTEVRVQLQYNPPAGIVGAVVSMLWGEEPSMQVQEDLHHLKQLLEAGEVLSTAGQPAGRGDVEHHKHTATKDREVQKASEESFPASDSPAYSH
jgi:uncharacterized membrane protein